MVVEIKKSFRQTILLLEPPDLIELFICCQYSLRINKQDTVKGVLCDGLNWDCFDLQLTDMAMQLTRYMTISCNSETVLMQPDKYYLVSYSSHSSLCVGSLSAGSACPNLHLIPRKCAIFGNCCEPVPCQVRNTITAGNFR